MHAEGKLLGQKPQKRNNTHTFNNVMKGGQEPSRSLSMTAFEKLLRPGRMSTKEDVNYLILQLNVVSL